MEDKYMKLLGNVIPSVPADFFERPPDTDSGSEPKKRQKLRQTPASESDDVIGCSDGKGCFVVWCGVVWCGVMWCGVVPPLEGDVM